MRMTSLLMMAYELLYASHRRAPTGVAPSGGISHEVGCGLDHARELLGRGPEMAEESLRSLGEAVRCLRQSTGRGDGALLVDQPHSGRPVQRVSTHLDDAERTPGHVCRVARVTALRAEIDPVHRHPVDLQPPAPVHPRSPLPRTSHADSWTGHVAGQIAKCGDVQR